MKKKKKSDLYAFSPFNFKFLSEFNGIVIAVTTVRGPKGTNI